MKFLLGLIVLSFSLTASAQKLKWETAVPLPSGFQLRTNTAVFPDGVGGGAMLFKLLKPAEDFWQCVWFDARGGIIATNRLATMAAWEPTESRLEILRVSSRVLDLAAFTYAADDETVTLRRLARGKAVVEKPLRARTPYVLNEQLASELPPVVDRLGFFTTQWTVTNLVVRRYTF